MVVQIQLLQRLLAELVMELELLMHTLRQERLDKY
jgi:hypothetical protein